MDGPGCKDERADCNTGKFAVNYDLGDCVNDRIMSNGCVIYTAQN